MQEFLEYVIRGLVSRPEAVTIRPVKRAGTTVYEVTVDPADTGKVIGKNGVTINAIRSLLQAGSGKRGLRCAVEISEGSPSGG